MISPEERGLTRFLRFSAGAKPAWRGGRAASSTARAVAAVIQSYLPASATFAVTAAFCKARFAQQEARRLDPLISTTINHTDFMLGDYQKALESSGGDFGYALGLTLAALGRTDEAIAKLRQREEIIWRLGKLYLTSLRALLEGHREESFAGLR